MRTKAEISFDVQADPSQVMDALMAVEMFAEWSPDFTDARVAGRDEAGRPRRVFVQVDISNTPDMQVWEFDWSDTRMSWEVTDSTRGIRGGGSFDVTPAAGGSQVVLRVEQHTPVPLPGFLAKRTIRRTYETLVENLTDYAEQFGDFEAYDLV